MKKWMAGLVIGGIAATFALDAEAQRRFGGGKNFGRQSPQVQQRQATPPQKAPDQAVPQAGAAQQTPAAARPGATGAATAAPAARSPMRGALMGLAAGLGIAALASGLGLGEALTMLLTALLIGIALMLVLGFFIRRTRREAPAYGAAGAARPGTYAHVGYETSPAPIARSAELPTEAPAARPGSAMDELLGGQATVSGPWGIPPGFDADAFLANAKAHYARLQQAWDSGDLEQLSDFTSDQMFIALTHELRARAGQSHTEIVAIDAELLGIESNADEYVASVKFEGTVRVDGETERVSEVWNLAKPVRGGGWVLAGIQQVN
jgi:predicted lipid-binding transport protein (Tim44 family)